MRTGRAMGMLVAVAGCGVLLGGCSSVFGAGDEVEPYTVTYVNDPYPDLEPAQGDPGRLASVALGPARDAAPVESSQGVLQVRDTEGQTIPATLDVLGVHATDLSTVLRVRIRAEEPILPADDVWDTDRMGYYFDTVTMEVPGEMVLSPSFFRYAEGVFGKNCLCSELIGQVGPRGVTFYTYYGPLPEGTTTVGVQVSGFDQVLVPVDWAESSD